MTAIEAVLQDLNDQRVAALAGDEQAMVRFAKLALAAWPTIKHAMEELNRRRIA